MEPDTNAAAPIWVLLGAKRGDNQQLLAIAEAAVVGMPDNVYGERICAFVTLRDGAVAPSTAAASSTSRRITRRAGASPAAIRRRCVNPMASTASASTILSSSSRP